MFALLRIMLVCALAAVAASTDSAQAQEHRTFTRLPLAIRRSLDRRFAKWRFANAIARGNSEVKDERNRQAADVIAGDFDGDGQRDYAVQIVDELPKAKQQQVIVFLRRRAGYRYRTLEKSTLSLAWPPEGDPGSETSLVLMRKGTKDYSYSRKRYFLYRHDSVGVFSEKGGSSYIWLNGRFVSDLTSD